MKISEEEKLDIIAKCLKEVAPEKITEKIGIETSITNDLEFDSIEVMDLLINLRTVVSSKGKSKSLAMDELLEYLFDNNNTDIKVYSLVKFMDELQY